MQNFWACSDGHLDAYAKQRWVSLREASGASELQHMSSFSNSPPSATSFHLLWRSREVVVLYGLNELLT